MRMSIPSHLAAPGVRGDRTDLRQSGDARVLAFVGCASDRAVAEQALGRKSAQDTLRSGLWHPLNIPLPRAPSKRELQHGFGPAGCAVLLQARFDRRFDFCPSGDLGGEEGCAAARASAMLEPPLGATVFNVKR